MGQPRDNKPSFMQVLRLPIHPSLRGRELPRPTRSTHRLPNPTDTDLGHHASIQMTTGRRRTLITGRTILAPVGTTILTRVINWGARPRTRLVPAVPATSGCRHRRCHAGGSQARRDTRSRWLPWPLPADHRFPTRGRAKYRPAPPGEDGSPAAAGGCSRGARAGRSRRHGTTPAGPPPEPRGPPPGASPPR